LLHSRPDRSTPLTVLAVIIDARVRRSYAQFIARDTSYRIQSLVDCTANALESEFSV
jgi:hypothetical protein